MDAIKYLKEKKRMCDSYPMCEGCPIYTVEYDICKFGEVESVAIVEKWAEEHPQKTMLMDFIEKYPNAPLRWDGVPCACPWALGYVEKRECFNFCKDCWNRPL